MKQNKLFNLLQSLSPNEFRDLEEYAKSPFFIKRRTDIPSFYKILKRFYPFQDITSLTKEELFKAVYGKQPYVDKKFRKLQSDFVKIVEHYLLYLENELDRFEKDMRLVGIYGKRNVYEEFKKGTHKLLNQLEALTYQDANYFKKNYELKSDFYFHPKTENRTEMESLVEGLNDLESFFVLERTKLGVDLTNMGKIYQKNYEFNIDDFSDIIPKDNQTFELFRLAFLLMRNRDSATYLKLTQLFFNETDNLSNKNQLLFFSLLQNFATQQIRVEEKKYFKYIIELYEFGLKEKIIFNNGKINDVLFINIIKVGLKVGNYDWVDQIINLYKDTISEKQNGLTIKLGKAYLLFFKGEYFKVINSLKEEKLENVLNHQSLRILLLRAYFKLFLTDKTYYSSLQSNCLSFEKYVNRDKEVNIQKKKANLNFSKITRKISKAIYENKWGSRTKSSITLELKQTKLLNYKSWLLEELKKLHL